MMKNNKVVILLSGGLDSLASLALAKEEYDVVKAIHFSYGQMPKSNEIEACQRICSYYDVELELIDINWLANLCADKNSLEDNDSYWIPNRNALFVSVAACYAEKLGCGGVVLGANIEEAQSFKDNSLEFQNAMNELLKYSTQTEVRLLAPFIEKTKLEIIKKALELEAPLRLVWSCYSAGDKHCGVCPSCKLLKQALFEAQQEELLETLF